MGLRFVVASSLLTLCVACSTSSKAPESQAAATGGPAPIEKPSAEGGKSEATAADQATNESKMSAESSQEANDKVVPLPKKAPVAKDSESDKIENAVAPAKASKSEHATKGHAATAEKSVPAKQALGWLENGNKRYLKHQLRKDGQSRADIVRLSKGQHPHTIVLSCSDSRVPPEVVFDQKLGEIFVIRTAGESLDHNVVASIEYAVSHFGTRLLLVMGHTSCGAIKATMDTAEGADAGSPSLNHLIEDIRPRLKTVGGAKPSDDSATEAWANATGIVEELKRFSPIIRTAVEKGDLEIRAALYHLKSGEVQIK